MVVLWQCNYCKDVVSSNSRRSHEMNYCKCGKSAMDPEEAYSRQMGDLKIIKRTKNESND